MQFLAELVLKFLETEPSLMHLNMTGYEQVNSFLYVGIHYENRDKFHKLNLHQQALYYLFHNFKMAVYQNMW
jgi:hypothetical protein